MSLIKRIGVLPFILVLCLSVLAVIVVKRSGLESEYVESSASGDPAETSSTGTDSGLSAEYATLRLAVAGDLVAHDAIREEASTDEGFDFRPIMESVRDVTRQSDIALVCLEAALVESGYMGYPMFKAPDALAQALADTGFTLVTTASNHALDGLGNGLVRTLDVLDENGLAHVGTYRSYEEWSETNGITVLEENGISIAFIAYTYGTNAININDVGGHAKAVNVFTRDYQNITPSDIDYDRISSDMAVARSLDTDLIAVIMHWGIEYQTAPNSMQTGLADYLIDEGADLILGGHPHVPQPLELRSVPDGQGGQRNVFINYCMGNFLSSMNDENTKLTGIAQVEIKKNLTTGEATVEAASYVPYYMADLGDFGAYSTEWRYRLLDLHEAIDGYEEKLLNGEDTAPINDEMYRDMLLSLESIHNIFGKEYDSYDSGTPDEY